MKGNEITQGRMTQRKALINHRICQINALHVQHCSWDSIWTRETKDPHRPHSFMCSAH